ncbi:MAG: hypothetical protein JSU01_21365 [Bacteroidetes bacterium]|nr:hypothetical protein [Bacteroidota bacterium]
MPAILKQRNFLVTRIFEISDKSLKVKIKKPLNYFEQNFSFDELGTKTETRQKIYIPGLVGTGIMLLMTILFFFSYLNDSKKDPFYETLICLVAFLFFVFMTLALHENIVKLFLVDMRFLTFYYSSPDKKAVSDFLLNLKEAQKDYLLKRYAKQDSYLSQDQLQGNLNWLRNNNIIDNAELEDLKRDILVKTQSDSSIGFKFGNHQST